MSAWRGVSTKSDYCAVDNRLLPVVVVGSLKFGTSYVSMALIGFDTGGNAFYEVRPWSECRR